MDVGKAELPSILSSTDLEDIYNADETALYGKGFRVHSSEQCFKRIGKICGCEHGNAI